MQYTKKQFIEDVKKEAAAIRRNAAPDELNNLNIKEFNPLNEEECIYGQMTGNCRSIRAVDLITKCCKRFFKNEVFGEFDDCKSDVEFSEALGTCVNGKKSETPYSLEYISSIEAYIALPTANTKNLIAYLKGETNDLNL